VTARGRLNSNEQWLAYLIGLGIALAMLAFFFIALGTVDDSRLTNSLLIAGVAVIILGIGLWLFFEQPWKQFDDLKTPYYTGHDEQALVPAEAHKSALVEVTPEESALVPTADKTPPTEPDDLTLIEGVGPKTAAALAEGGITTFAQIAAMTSDELVEVAREHGARISKADTWPSQARQAAEGDLIGLQELQDSIKGGVRYDDLTDIEGIGPKSNEALHAGGIRSFADLAAATPEHILTALGNAGLNTNLFDPTTWPEQAGFIVRGDLSGLKALQDRLKGGRT
jgi:predicted flap endonuclease-1-like 5' DNA nuclease